MDNHDNSGNHIRNSPVQNSTQTKTNRMNEFQQYRICPHCSHTLDEKTIIEWGGWKLDEKERCFVKGTPGENIKITKTETLILSIMLRRQGRTISTDEIYSNIVAGKAEKDWPDVNIIRVYIYHLRRKFKAENLTFFRLLWDYGYYAVPVNKDDR